MALSLQPHPHKILLLLLTFLIPTIAFTQNIYSVDYSNQADIRVYVVGYENQYDLKVDFVEYENQAKWRNKSKMALLF